MTPDERALHAAEGGRSAASAGGVATVVSDEQRVLFRAEAIQAKLEEGRTPPPLAIAPPWTRAVFALATLFVAAFAVLAVVGRVEQTGHARGVLRVAGGSRALFASIQGTVIDVRVASGEIVAAGDVLVTIDSAPTRAALGEAEAAVTLADNQLTRFRTQRVTLFRERQRRLRERAALLAARERNQGTTIRRLQQKESAVQRMHEGGVASNMDVSAAADDLASAERERMRILEELAATNLDASALEADLDAEATRLEVDAQKARDRRDALAVAARDTTIRASAAGRIETLLVKSGDTVTPGSVVARIVPSDAARQIVAFLPERDRAFLRIGMDARLDLDQFPVTEFGFLHARVERIGSDIATVHEIREALGEQTPPNGAYYRVELVPRMTERTANLESLVRPGSMLTARITLRERRLAAIVFEPIRRLLEGGT